MTSGRQRVARARRPPSRRSRRCRGPAPRSRRAAPRARRAIASRQRTSSSRCSVLTTQKESSTATACAYCHRSRCASASSTPPPTRRPTTARCAPRWRGGGRGRAGHEPLRRTARCRRRAATRCARTSTAARRAGRGAALRRRLAQHVPDMLRYRRAAERRRRALPVADGAAARRAPAARLQPPARAHRPRRAPARAARRASSTPSAGSTSAWTRSSCTPSTGARGCVDELGVDPGARPRHPARRLRRTSPRCRRRAAAARAGRRPSGPVVLFFGLLRPYKGLDVLLEAWRGIEDAELWIVGAAAHGHRAAARRGAARRALRRRASSPTPRSPALFRRADLVVLPYREIEQSGVLFTALAFGMPLRAQRRRRLPRGRRRPARPSSSPPGDAGGAARRARAPARRPRRAAPRWPTARAARWPTSATPGTRSRAPTSSSTTRCWRVTAVAVVFWVGRRPARLRAGRLSAAARAARPRCAAGAASPPPCPTAPSRRCRSSSPPTARRR